VLLVAWEDGQHNTNLPMLHYYVLYSTSSKIISLSIASTTGRWTHKWWSWLFEVMGRSELYTAVWVNEHNTTCLVTIYSTSVGASVLSIEHTSASWIHKQCPLMVEAVRHAERSSLCGWSHIDHHNLPCRLFQCIFCVFTSMFMSLGLLTYRSTFTMSRCSVILTASS
jgi:hypothetical protein